MSQTLLRGLAILEAVGERPATVSQLASTLDLDKAVVSRLVSRAETVGWLVRTNGIITLGPRAAALGRVSPERSFERRAAELAHAVAGATGLDVIVNQLGGDRAHILAHAVGRHALFLAESSLDAQWIVSTAGGACLLALADDDTRAMLEAAAGGLKLDTDSLDVARSGELVVDRGGVIDGIGCLALPWSGPQVVVPTTLTCIGALDDVDAVEPVAAAAMRAAVLERATAASVLVAASDAMSLPVDSDEIWR